MLDRIQAVDKLYILAEEFKIHMKNKEYPQAKHCYETAREVSVFMELDRENMDMLFGARGERGVILRNGLFGEEMVQKAYYGTVVKKDPPVMEAPPPW